MSEKLVKLFNWDLTTLNGARLSAEKFFMQLAEHHGAERARKILMEWGKPPSKRRINEMKNWALLNRYDEMDHPNVAELARRIVKENATLSKEQQLTPRYT